jgi:diaminohydroxyphosphoribosylaminopyrimidine deaminase / 5-amino-6-(5-phosphoribosylamino)uracil reductase
MRFNSHDISYMRFALQISSKEQGQVWPNPSVGCVVVSPKDKNLKQLDIIVGTGYTGKNGIPHAEVAALSEAKGKTVGSILYVTLEPCCHFGKTSPCTKEIIKNGISRVVIAMIDPNPLVSGKGIKELEDNGVEVLVGCCEKEAIIQNSGFISRITKNRPFVSLKLAVTKDNFICSSVKERLKITSQKVDEYIHALRAKYDGLLIGNGTFMKDNPKLNVRLQGYDKHTPCKFILSSTGEIDSGSNLFMGRFDRPLYLIIGNEVTEAKINQLKENNINIIQVESDQQKGLLSLEETLYKIGDIGINKLLIEPGINLFKNLIKENIPDDIYIFKSKTNIGNEGIFIKEFEDLFADSNANFKLSYKREVFDCELIYYKKRVGDN